MRKCFERTISSMNIRVDSSGLLRRAPTSFMTASANGGVVDMSMSRARNGGDEHDGVSLMRLPVA